MADVLAKMSSSRDITWWRNSVAMGNILSSLVGSSALYPLRWDHPSAAEAFEALIAAGLLPMHWSDQDVAPRWWCQTCDGAGAMPAGWDDVAGQGDSCWRCGKWREDLYTWVDGPGHIIDPPSHAALVAVASLGADNLARAEAIVEETWRARVVWRVMTAEKIREHHWSTYDHLRIYAPAPAEPPVAALLALGLHLVAIDDSHITLATEALP